MRQLEPDESHFGANALRNTPSTIAPHRKKFFSTRERNLSVASGLARKTDVKENRQRWEKDGKNFGS